MAREQVAGQQRDVLGTLAQGRQVQGDDRQPVVEILAEAAVLDHLPEIAIGRGDHPDIAGQHVAPAHREVFPALEHAQQLDLGLACQLPDLVEEQRAAIGQREEALAIVDRAGERAAHVAEQLALEQRGGQRAGIDAHHRPIRAQRGVMDGARHQLLAGAALARHQHRRIGGRDLLDGGLDALHGRARAHQVDAGLGGPGGARGEVMGAGIQRPAHQGLDQEVVEGLAQEVVGALAHRPHRGVPFGEGGHDHHEDVRMPAADLLEQHQPIHRLHAQVAEHQLDAAVLGERCQGLLAVGGEGDRVPFSAQDDVEHAAQAWLIINHQESCHAGMMAGPASRLKHTIMRGGATTEGRVARGPRGVCTDEAG